MGYMIYILVVILMLQVSGSDSPEQHVVATQWTTQRDCEDTEGVTVTDADKDPDVLGWYVLPASCEGVEVPRKN